MKLRNKRTGEVMSIYEILTSYDTLAELNEEWEDYKPAEPLIKDDKIRKAVRAWAEAWGFDRVYAYGDDHTNTTRLENGNAGVGIEIDDSKIEPLDKRKCYTIAELCGEEEE